MLFEGRDILTADARALHQLRGGQIGMVFQEPMSALNPLHTIGDQIGEVMTQHEGLHAPRRWNARWNCCG